MLDEDYASLNPVGDENLSKQGVVQGI